MSYLFNLENKSRSIALPLRPHQGFLDRYLSVATAIVIAFVYLNIPIYVYTLNPALLPKYFYFIFLFAVAPLLTLKTKAFLSYLASPFPLWIIALVLFNTIYLLGAIADQNGAIANLINSRIQIGLMVFFLGFLLAITRTAAYEGIFPVFAALIPCTVIVDFLVPGLLYPVNTVGAVPGRAAGSFINPTIASEAILLGFIMACGVVKKGVRTLLLLLSGLAIVLTFTRSAIVAWILLYLFLWTKKVLPKSIVVVVLVVLGIPLVIGSFETYLSSRPEFAEGINNIEARLHFFSSGNVEDDSSRERLAVLMSSWDLFLHNPIFGAGAGATQLGPTYDWPHHVSTHNQFMMLAAEYGLIGISFWIALFFILWRGKYIQDLRLQHAMLFLFLYMTMFTHNMLDASYWLITFSLVSGRRRV
jgi:O-antigen ligase